MSTGVAFENFVALLAYCFNSHWQEYTAHFIMFLAYSLSAMLNREQNVNFLRVLVVVHFNVDLS